MIRSILLKFVQRRREDLSSQGNGLFQEKFFAPCRVAIFRISSRFPFNRSSILIPSAEMFICCKKECNTAGKLFYHRERRDKGDSFHVILPDELGNAPVNRKKLLKRLSQGAFNNVGFSDFRSLVKGLDFAWRVFPEAITFLSTRRFQRWSTFRMPTAKRNRIRSDSFSGWSSGII